MKIVLFGDSLTWGGYGGSYARELALLRPQHTWINAAVGGNTVINLLRRVEADVIAHQPDGVFIMIGVNDAISYCQPKTRSYFRQRHGIADGVVTPEQFASSYRDLLARLQAAQIVTWIGLPPAEYNPTVVQAVKAYNQRAAEIARSMGIETLDLMAAFNPPSIPDRPELDLNYIFTIGRREETGWDDFEGERERGGYCYSFDGLHFTPEAARRAALIAAFIDG
jgi:Lysophospholipase L1 and related esterases